MTRQETITLRQGQEIPEGFALVKVLAEEVKPVERAGSIASERVYTCLVERVALTGVPKP